MRKITISVFVGILLGITGSVFAMEMMDPAMKKFPDVDYTAYYADALNNMVNLGIISGYQNGNFGPDDAVTRAQLVTILDRYDVKKQEQADQLLADTFCQNKGNLQLLDYDGGAIERCGIYYKVKPPVDLDDAPDVMLNNTANKIATCGGMPGPEPVEDAIQCQTKCETTNINLCR